MDYYRNGGEERETLEKLAADGLSQHYVCLGNSGTFVMSVADLELTLTYWQEENIPACATDLSTDICDAIAAGGSNPCMKR